MWPGHRRCGSINSGGDKSHVAHFTPAYAHTHLHVQLKLTLLSRNSMLSHCFSANWVLRPYFLHETHFMAQFKKCRAA